MIFGIGVDVLEMKRITGTLERFGSRFIDHLLMPQEREQLALTQTGEKKQREEFTKAAAAYQQKVRFYSIMGVLSVMAIIATILFVAFRKQQKANHLLHEQKEEIEAQRDERDIDRDRHAKRDDDPAPFEARALARRRRGAEGCSFM